MANRIVQGAVPTATTVTGTTAAVSTTIGTTSFTGRSVYLAGFSYVGVATAAATITLTVTYAPVTGAAVTLGTWSYNIGTTNPTHLEILLSPPFIAPVPITGLTNATTSTAVGSVTVSASAAGAGGSVALNAWGYIL